MNIEMAPVAALVSDPANARRHDERNIAAIMASLTEYGHQKPIVLDASGVVIAGNGQLEAARRLGWEKIAVRRSGLSGAKAKGYAVADNRTAELATWDETALAEHLEEVRNSGVGLESTGFDDRELGSIIARIADEIASTPSGDAADSRDDDDANGPSPGAPSKSQFYPLAIVLDRPAWNRWNALKEDIGVKSDRDAIVSLMERAGA